MRIAVVSGNPRPGSRTLQVGRRLAFRLSGEDPSVVELSGIGSELFDSASPSVAGAKRIVLDADVVVVASPTYKAAYTGLLKSFLDHFGAGELRGRSAVPLMTIGSDQHHLVAEHHLRPVLAELGASVPTASFPFPTAQFDELDEVVDRWIADNEHGVRAMKAIAREPATR